MKCSYHLDEEYNLSHLEYLGEVLWLHPCFGSMKSGFDSPRPDLDNYMVGCFVNLPSSTRKGSDAKM